MARSDPDATVTQSLLDRLIDRDPDLRHDPPISHAQSVRLLKSSLRRDLEWLLNSRRVPDEAGESFEELNRSLYHFGLPDFSGLSISSPRDRNNVLRTLETTIANFEPRLRDVTVHMIETSDANARALRFQIEGMLQMDPSPEQISFDTVLQLSSGEYQIKGERGA